MISKLKEFFTKKYTGKYKFEVFYKSDRDQYDAGYLHVEYKRFGMKKFRKLTEYKNTSYNYCRRNQIDFEIASLLNSDIIHNGKYRVLIKVEVQILE